MFDLSQPFISSTVLAFGLAMISIYSLWGYGNKNNSFLYTIIFFPFSLCILSLFLPQTFLSIAVHSFYGVGLLLAIKKTFQTNFKENLLQVKNDFLFADRSVKFFLIFTIIYIGSSYMRASVPGSFVDSMTYHMGAPKEWTLFLNGPGYNPNNPASFTASYLEYFNYSIFLILKPLFLHLKELPGSQFEYLCFTMLMFGQYISALFGLILIPYLIVRIFKDHKLFAYALIIFLLSLRDITWTWTSPKNAPIPLFCVLFGYSIIRELIPTFSKNLSRWFLAFLIIGIGLGTKMTNSYVVIPSIIFLIAINIRSILKFQINHLAKTALVMGGAILLGIAPLLIRNYLETGNPLFPVPNALFPEKITSDIFIAEYARFSNHSSWPAAWDKIIVLIKNIQLSIFFVLAMIFGPRAIMVFFAILLIFLAKNTGDAGDWRYFPTLFMLLIISAESFYLKINHDNFKLRKPLLIICGLVILAFSQFQIERPFKYPKRFYSKPTLEILHQVPPGKHFDIVFASNQKNYQRTNYVVSSFEGHYYSRFPFIDYLNSNPKYRQQYFEDQVTAKRPE